MTSVPKPLKFLRPHFDKIKGFFKDASSSTKKESIASNKELADILSVIATTYADERGQNEALYYRLKGVQGPIDAWGHEYVR